MDPQDFRQASSWLSELGRLSEEQTSWLLKAWLEGLPQAHRQSILEPYLVVPSKPTPAPAYLRAKVLLSNDLDLTSADKLLLAAYAVCDLNEAESFTGRQITEMLKESGNVVGNVTQALTGLIQRGWVEASKMRQTAQAQKQYSLTKNGQNRLQMLLADSELTSIFTIGILSRCLSNPSSG